MSEPLTDAQVAELRALLPMVVDGSLWWPSMCRRVVPALLAERDRLRAELASRQGGTADAWSKLRAERDRLREALDEAARDANAQADIDLISSNQEAIRRVLDDALAKIKRHVESDGVVESYVLRVIAAALSFHPMHAESWGGWPEEDSKP